MMTQKFKHFLNKMSLKADIQNNIKLGLMVTLSLAILIVAIYFVGSRQSMFGQTFYISAVFKNVNGLQSGNNVRYAGINVGTVDQIIIVSDSTVEVKMKLGDEVRKFIKKDAFASIGSDGLVGNMLVNISPGSGDQPSVENNDHITSFSRTDTDDILSTLSSTNENIALLSRDLLSITESINYGQGTVTALLKDTTMVKNLQQILINVEQVTSGSTVAVKNLEKLTTDLQSKESLLGFIIYDTVVVTELKEVVAQISESSQNLLDASAQLKTVTSALSKSSGPLNTLLYDSTISQDLKQSIHNIREGTVLFNENMEAMRENFLFKKYFKNQEKEKNKKN
jgi:phospholipid/cholesterol/gamma-HCH transport system substrate-binding protein